MEKLWSKDKEIVFFSEARKFATPEQLFYVSDDRRYYAYWPKNYRGIKNTLQSRNSLIGRFTEKYIVDLFQEYANKLGLYSVQGVICEEIGLTPQSCADAAICRTKDIIQKPENIIMVFEVKMSVVWNWELKLTEGNDELICLGDYKTHQGNPGLLRSDSMLKAIGKSINIRVSDYSASKIPIIIIGNTPITTSYYKKVDFLKNAGIIQGFWSINPFPLDYNGENIKRTAKDGFLRIDSFSELINSLDNQFIESKEFFSSMKSKSELGKIIELANEETDIEKKAEKFLALIRV